MTGVDGREHGTDGGASMAMVFDARTLDISLCEVAAFLAVVHFGGFTVAARGMHVSQPGLSARVQRLERALGAAVIDRSVRRLTLTPAGRAFLPVAERVMQEITDATARIRSSPLASSPNREQHARGLTHR
ncbi:hypothetical protein GCM10023339_10030 [Alloalcanivorax gelatiniphagus]